MGVHFALRSLLRRAQLRRTSPCSTSAATSRPTGLRCHAAALSGKPWCYFHARLHRLHSPQTPDSKKLKLPPIEDSSSVLLALGQVMRALDSPFMDCRRAGLMLYGLQIAAQLTGRRSVEETTDLVRTVCNPQGDPVDPSSPNADESIDILAPDNTVCEPPQDCRNCPHSEVCENYEEPDGDETDDAEDNSGQRTRRKDDEDSGERLTHSDSDERQEEERDIAELDEKALLRRARAMLAL